MDDAELMREICEGNHVAFATLVKRHTQTYFALAFRSLQNSDDAEDVVQASFIKLWQKPTLWNVNKSRFTTWFYQVILNACHDYRRKHKRWVNMDQPVMDTMLKPTISEQRLLEQKQRTEWQARSLEFAIGQLPTSQRDALNLVVYSRLPQKQAAAIMGVSLKALESLLSRAKRSIANTVAQLSEEYEPTIKRIESQRSG